MPIPFIAAAALGGTALGGFMGGQQADAQNRQRNADIEASRYTPWSHIEYKPQAVTASALGGALQGGMTGLNFAQQFGGAAKPEANQPMAMAGGPADNGGAPQQSIYEQMKTGKSFNFMKA